MTDARKTATSPTVNEPQSEELPPPVHSVYGGGAALIASRNSFYDSAYIILLRTMLAQLVTLVLICLIIHRLFGFTDSRDYYFPVYDDGSLITYVPTNDPMYDEAEYKKWLEKAIVDIFTFGYHDYYTRMQEARRYFTTDGFASFMQALTDATIQAKIGVDGFEGASQIQQVVRAFVRPDGAPVILEQGDYNGTYTWRSKIGLSVVFSSLRGEFREVWNVEVIVVRMPTSASRYGLGILSLIARPVEEGK